MGSTSSGASGYRSPGRPGPLLATTSRAAFVAGSSAVIVVMGLVRSVSSWMAARVWWSLRYAAESVDRVVSTDAWSVGSIWRAATRAMFRSCVPTESSTSRCWRV